ncbi:hypothetical protein ACJJTC_005258 [Scirpophaga incertulas]
MQLFTINCDPQIKKISYHPCCSIVTITVEVLLFSSRDRVYSAYKSCASDIEYYNSTSVAKSLKNNKSEDFDSEDETNTNRRPYQRPQKAGKRQLFESDEEGSNKQSDQRPRKLTKKVVRDTKAVYESDDEESNKT